MSLAKLLNLKEYAPSELKVSYKCSKCSKILNDSVYKRCPNCRSMLLNYMQRYRYDKDHDISGALDEKRLKKVDQDFEQFLQLVKKNNLEDVLKLVINIKLKEYLIPKGDALDLKKKLLKVHFIDRILVIIKYKFILRSSCIRSNKLYLRYICHDDYKAIRNKSNLKLKCESKLSIVLNLESNDLRVEYNHKCHEHITM